MGKSRHQGFTLIELSIVLVIIGLIVGGILGGRSLINSAKLRRQLSQVSALQTAVNTFRVKYNAIPGDISATTASQLGFTLGSGCNGSQGYRDNNGLLESSYSPYHQLQGRGEVGLFWMDLSASGLIEGTFPNSGGTPVTCNSNLTLSLTQGAAYLGNYFPVSKIADDNFIYVYSLNGQNWFGLSALTGVDGARTYSNTTLTVIEAYSMDNKLDDGFPVLGVVQAAYENGTGAAAYAPGAFTSGDTTTTCMSVYPNSVRQYSLTAAADSGSGRNCALSFRFQ